MNPCDRDDYVPISACWSDGYTGQGWLNFEVVDAGGAWHEVNDTAWNDPILVPMYAWRHVAFVWDLAGIAGTADKMRIYRDGELVASNTDTIADIMVDDGVVKLLGHHEYYRYNQPTAYMDNIKVWDYAKTDFSDRFIEGFSLPPIAEAGGSYTVAEGSSVPLDGAASYDPDPGDVLTYAWDTACSQPIRRRCDRVASIATSAARPARRLKSLFFSKHGCSRGDVGVAGGLSTFDTGDLCLLSKHDRRIT